MSDMDTTKDLKRKNTSTDYEDRSSQSEKKRRKKDNKGGGSSNRPKHYPLSERQQLALLMQMTAEENNEQTPTTPTVVKKPSGGSGRKDKVNKRNERGETPLHLATIRGELPAIMDLVKQGADVNIQDYAGWTPLHEACNHGFQDIAQYLLEAGAIVNSKGFNDDYPLHDAVMNEHVDLVELLLKHGANPLLANKQGERPLDLCENEKITEMMRNEILPSDDSDQNDSKEDEDTKRKPQSSDESGKQTIDVKLSSSTSRELFKQFDADTFRKQSTDSDDSDDIPLSRRRTTSSHSLSKSNHSSRERKVSSSGFLETKRSKNDNKRRIFSTESSESADSEVKSLKYENKSDFDSFKNFSSDDDFSLQSSRRKEDRSSTDSLSLAEKKSMVCSKRPSVAISFSKTATPDVYDFSPTADDSNENTAISLKPENRSSKWNPSAKQQGIFSRKTPSIFSSGKGFDFSTKKSRKSSKDNYKTEDSSDNASDKTALIKPIHETSEMLFDRLFKSPQKDDDNVFTFDTKSKSPLLPNRSLPQTTPVSSMSSFSKVGFDEVTKSSNISDNQKTEPYKTLLSDSLLHTSTPQSSSESVSKITSTSTTTASVETSRLEQGKAVLPDAVDKTLGSEHSSTLESSSLSTSSNKEASKSSETGFCETTAFKPDPPDRTISLDMNKEVKEPSKKSLDDGKNLKIRQVDNKSVKKVKSDAKDKVFKTLSDPVKKPSVKPTAKDSKMLSGDNKSSSQGKSKPQVPLSSTKKESKSEQKKLSLLPESSSFLNDLDKTSLQRQKEKLKRKKLAQKKTKSILGAVKTEEKKTSKKSEVKLIDTDSWLAAPAEKSQAEKPKKALQRTAKRISDSASESERHSTLPCDSDSAAAPLPNLTSSPAGTTSQKPWNSPAKVVESDVLPSRLPQPSIPVTVVGTSLDTAGPLSQLVSTPVQFVESGLTSPVVSSAHTSPLQHSSPVKPNVDLLPPITYLPAPLLSTNLTTTMSDAHVIDATRVTAVGNTVEESDTAPEQPESTDKNSSTIQLIDPDKSLEVAGEKGTTMKEVPPEPNAEAIEPVIPDEERTIGQIEKEITEQEKMLRLYIQERLAAGKFELAQVQPLRNRIPMHVLMAKKKDPTVDKLNVIEERLAIQQKMFEKRKKISSVIPQAPQCYWEYMTFTGGYLLNESRESRLSVPVLAPPSSLCQPMVELFKAHEEKRVRLRVQHAIQREKLIISCEQEIMRVHSRAARTNQNQQTPFSACAMLMDCEVYNMPRQSSDADGGKTSIRDRFNTRTFLSWLQDVDDKFVKIKSALLARQRHEAEALHAVQKTEWILKCQELDPSQRTLKPGEINEVYVPVVNIADDFDLLPA